jgi:hypothetical protein
MRQKKRLGGSLTRPQHFRRCCCSIGGERYSGAGRPGKGAGEPLHDEDFAGGVERGVDDLLQVLSGDDDEFKRRAAEQRDRPSGTEGLRSLFS